MDAHELTRSAPSIDVHMQHHAPHVAPVACNPWGCSPDDVGHRTRARGVCTLRPPGALFSSCRVSFWYAEWALRNTKPVMRRYSHKHTHKHTHTHTNTHTHTHTHIHTHTNLPYYTPQPPHRNLMPADVECVRPPREEGATKPAQAPSLDPTTLVQCSNGGRDSS